MPTTTSPLFPVAEELEESRESSEVAVGNGETHVTVVTDVESQHREGTDSHGNEHSNSHNVHFVSRERGNSNNSANRDPNDPHHHHNRSRAASHLPPEIPREPIKKSSPVGKFLLFYNAIVLAFAEFYKAHARLPQFLHPVYDILEDFFECIRCGSSVELEFFAGLINFFSCTYVLAVVPPQMATAGYDSQTSAAVISLITGLGSIFCGIVTNTPLIVAPTTAVSIYFVSNLQQYSLSAHDGNMVVAYVGIAIVLLGIIGPLARLISKLIPNYIQIGTTVGIGLITSLSGYQEIGIVEQGRYTLLSVGKITDEICIAISGLIVIAILVYYHSKVAYLIGIIWGTFFWWTSQNLWPTEWASAPTFTGDFFGAITNTDGILFTFEMIFLIILTLFGLAKALCALADISPTYEAIPKGRILLIVVGIANIVSGLMYGPPIILSPECASGIKAGGRTGLSACVAGILFLLSIFFAPLFTSIPAAATSPVLIMIGMILFQNVKSIEFSTKYGIAAFVCLTLIPFTDSIIAGIGFGYVTFTIISILNGDAKGWIKMFFKFYFPSSSEEDDKDPATRDSSFDESSISRLSARMARSPRGKRESGDISIGKESSEQGETTGPIVTRGRRASSAAVVVERARRNTVAFFQNVVTEVDLENDFVVRIL
eukprot:gene15317-17128_t